jgi:hypothetical protein
MMIINLTQHQATPRRVRKGARNVLRSIIRVDHHGFVIGRERQ